MCSIPKPQIKSNQTSLITAFQYSPSSACPTSKNNTLNNPRRYSAWTKYGGRSTVMQRSVFVFFSSPYFFLRPSEEGEVWKWAGRFDFTHFPKLQVMLHKLLIEIRKRRSLIALASIAAGKILFCIFITYCWLSRRRMVIQLFFCNYFCND